MTLGPKITYLDPSPLFLLFLIVVSTGLTQSEIHTAHLPRSLIRSTLSFLFVFCLPSPVSARRTVFGQVLSCTWIALLPSLLVETPDLLQGSLKCHLLHEAFCEPLL